MTISRWKVMAGVLGVSIGGLAAYAGQCPKPGDSHRTRRADDAPKVPLDAPKLPSPGSGPRSSAAGGRVVLISASTHRCPPLSEVIPWSLLPGPLRGTPPDADETGRTAATPRGAAAWAHSLSASSRVSCTVNTVT